MNNASPTSDATAGKSHWGNAESISEPITGTRSPGTTSSSVTATRIPATTRPATDASHQGVRSSRRTNSSTTVAMTTKIAGIRWHRIVNPNSTAPRARSAPVRMPRNTTARNRKANVSEIENANSPAMVEAPLPPRIVNPLS